MTSTDIDQYLKIRPIDNMDLDMPKYYHLSDDNTKVSLHDPLKVDADDTHQFSFTKILDQHASLADTYYDTAIGNFS